MGRTSIVCGAAIGLLAASWSGASAQALHSFPAGVDDGQLPFGGVIMDDAGVLYGTTLGGGTGMNGNGYAGGTVFSLTPPAIAKHPFVETQLHGFPAYDGDGEGPRGNLLADASGALYGTTGSGGSGRAGGTVFKLTPPAPGSTIWTEQVLHSFGTSPDGSYPSGGLAADASGALYGTAGFGGTAGSGVIFKLVPPARGQSAWTEQILYSFPQDDPSGYEPTAPVILDRHGNLFGVTQGGGVPGPGSICGCGTVFELSPPAPGATAWTYKSLYGFSALHDGALPDAGLIMDADGVLYGTTDEGGSSRNCPNRCGTVFKLTPPDAAGGTWTHRILHSFTAMPDGGRPVAGLAFDPQGNLYGTTSEGGLVIAGCKYGCGTVFKLTRPEAGATEWTETVYTVSTRRDGRLPEAGVLIGTDGLLYGTASEGSPNGSGTVFAIRP